MEQDQILTILNKLPAQPGCYQFIGSDNKILYIGKARSLKDRVRQYFVNSSDNRFFISKLPPLLTDIRIIITTTENEALLLEAELIRRHKPPFNVDLKDDKRYLSLRLAVDDKYPRLELVRKTAEDGACYYGPFSSASALKSSLRLIKEQFRLRSCTNHQFKMRHDKWLDHPRSTRPCLQYELKRCLAPCCEKCNLEEYRQAVNNVKQLLEGGEESLINSLTEAMQKLALEFKYEEAARVRDQIRAVQRSMESQTIVLAKKLDADIYAVAQDAAGTALTLLQIRHGVILDVRSHFQADLLDEPAEAISQYIRQWYYHQQAPKIICVPMELPWQNETINEISQRAGYKVTISHPQRGIFAKLRQKAQENANQELYSSTKHASGYETVAAQVAHLLNLKDPPHNLECIDISQLQATNVVGVTVAFKDGLPDKKNYRRYRIQGSTDDFAAVYEVVRRRVAPDGNNLPDHLPDLLVIDGGRGQLSAAYAALCDSKMENKVPLVALAKARTAPSDYRENNQDRQHERLFMPGRKNPYILREGTAIERLFVQLRDATHHAAITYHRKLRAKNARKSILDNISGLGPVRRRALINKFGSIEALSQATIEEISSVPGINKQLAEIIIGVLNP